jgi:FkbM family methyltransferase
MSWLRALRYARRYRNWREIERERAAGRKAHRAVLRAGVRFESPDDVNVLRVVAGVWFRGYYTPPGLEIGPDDVVVDVGANVGTFAVFAARRTRGRVVAVEPCPRNLAFLRRNLAANGCERVEIVECALGASDGTARLHLAASGVGHQVSARALGAVLEESVEVPARTLGSLIEERGLERIDLLKLDCEGAEGEVVGGSPGPVLARVRRIAMEFHDYASALSHRELARKLESEGCRTRLRRAEGAAQGFLYAWR